MKCCVVPTVKNEYFCVPWNIRQKLVVPSCPWCGGNLNQEDLEDKSFGMRSHSGYNPEREGCVWVLFKIVIDIFVLHTYTYSKLPLYETIDQPQTGENRVH